MKKKCCTSRGDGASFGQTCTPEARRALIFPIPRPREMPRIRPLIVRRDLAAVSGDRDPVWPHLCTCGPPGPDVGRERAKIAPQLTAPA